MNPDHISVQLYSLRNMESLESQFELLSQLGIRQAEAYSGLSDSVDTLLALTKHCNVVLSTQHVSIANMRSAFKATVDVAHRLGVKIVYGPNLQPTERSKTFEEWRSFAKELGGYLKDWRSEGIAFGWHNHNWDLAALPEGPSPVELFLHELPELLWEMDTAWVVRAGLDPVTLAKRYAGRIKTCHVKDLAPDGQCADEGGWADVGYGRLDIKAIVIALREAGAETFVLEHDNPSDAKRFVTRSHAALLKL